MKNSGLKVALALLCLSLGIIAYSFFDVSLDSADGKPEQRPVAATSRPRRPVFNQVAQPLPPNGKMERTHLGDAVAPLEIVTRPSSGEHYYVKIADWSDRKRTILTVFVRAGERTRVDLPLGSFELRYAAGRTWYGPAHLFGPNTAYAKAEKRLDFAVIGNRVSGYTVELYLQRDGNLRTTTIRAEDF